MMGIGGSKSGGGGSGLSQAQVDAIVAKAAPRTIPANRYVDADHRMFVFDGLGASTDASSTTRAYCIPYYIGYPALTAIKISIEVTTAVASSSARLAIYDNDGDEGGAKTLILDCGVVDTTSTGAKEITISQELDGIVYLFFVTNSGSVAIDCFTVSQDKTDVAVGTFGSGTSTNDARAQGARHDMVLGPVGSEASFVTDIEADFVGYVNFDDYPRIRLMFS